MARETKRLWILALLLAACGHTTGGRHEGRAGSGAEPSAGESTANGGTASEMGGATGATPADDAKAGASPAAGGRGTPAGEAGAAGDASAFTWCEGQLALFCEDFDRDPLLALWEFRSEQGGGKLQLDEQQHSSPPRAVLSTMPRLHPGDAAEAQLVSVFPQSGSGVIVAFDVFIERHTTDIDPYEPLPGSVELFHLVSGAHSLSLGVVFYPEHQISIFLSRPGGGSSWGWEGTLPLTTWFRLALDVTYSQDEDAIAALAFDGQELTRYAHTSIPLLDQDPMELHLGVRAREVAPSVTITYDNVTVDLR